MKLVFITYIIIVLDQNFIINTDRLRKSKELKVKVNFKASSDFLKLEESEIEFGEAVEVQGEVYIVDDQLIIHFDVLATVVSACRVCNGNAEAEIRIKDLYHAEDLNEVKGPYFDFGAVLREEILLELPRFVECNQGSCPERELIKPYLVEN